MFNDYINNAPDCAERVHNCIKNEKGEWVHKRTGTKSINYAHVPPYKRTHDSTLLRKGFGANPKGPLIKVLEEGDPEWLEHPSDPNTVLLQYDSNVLQNARKFADKRVEYRSKKYPWIEAVYKYPIWKPHPFDYDVIPITIPGFHGTGHYVVVSKPFLAHSSSYHRVSGLPAHMPTENVT